MKLSNQHIIIALLAIVAIVLLRNKLKVAAAAIVPTAGIGTNDVSYLGQSNLPRGILNNNPGNLKTTNPRQGWAGAVSNPDDPQFEQFEYYVYGLRAMLKLLRNNINRGFDTPQKLINRWAPPSDNNPTSTYASAVASALGVTTDARISADKRTIKILAESIEEFENGMQVMTDDDFERAWALI